MDDDLLKEIEKCLAILDENMDVLSNIEFDLDDENEDDLIPDMNLHNLFDMSEDIAESAKLKRAELNLARRQSEDLL